MNRIVVIGNGRAAKFVVEHIRALTPESAFSVFGPELPAREANWFKKHAVDLRQGILVTDIDRFARRITGSDGSRTVFHRLILSDCNPEVARRAKLDVGTGVLVNSYLQTSDGYVYALGNSVECYTPDVDLGSLEDQARVIAQHICWGAPRTISAEVAPAF